MTDADGLLASAVLYGATLLLIAVGTWISRDVVRKPAALLAIATAAFGSLLLIRHAPAGAEWQPLAWVPPEPKAGPAMRLSFPLRQRSLTDGADDSAGRGGRLEPRAPGRGGAAEEEDQSGPASSGGGGGGSGSGRGGFLASLLMPSGPRKLVAGDVVKDCPFCPEIVIVPGGRFLMGAAETDAEATAAEKPARKVSVWPGFAIGRYEVTIGEYTHFAKATGRAMPSCDGNPAPNFNTENFNTDERLPLTCVSWRDAAAYAGWLVRVTGRPYRLPSAAEWEYAARAANAPANAGADAHPQQVAAGPVRVESTPANAWSIHGMRGNLAEIVADCWQVSLAVPMPDLEQGCSTRMLKDGGWSEPSRWQRPAARRPVEASVATPTQGFRIVRDLR